MEQKKSSMFKKVSIVYLGWLGLYCLGMLVCRVTELEYRMWVWVLGNISIRYVFPLWLFFLWHRWHARRGGLKFLRYLVTAVFTVSFLIWSYFCFLFLVFSVEEERSLFGGYVAVNRAPALSRSYYGLCRSRAFFFREKAVWDTDFEIEYLERKYGQEFLEVPFDKENMLFYDRGAVYGETVPVSPAHPDLPVNVSLGRGLDDDYVRVLADWYLMEGCRELEISRSFEEKEGWGSRLYFSDGEDMEAVASDVQKLIDYAMQDNIFQKYAGMIRLSPENAEGHEYISVSFGGANAQGKAKTGYEGDVSLLEQHIEDGYRGILEHREDVREFEKIQDRTREEAEQKRAERADKERAEKAGQEEEGKPGWEEAERAGREEAEREDTEKAGGNKTEKPGSGESEESESTEPDETDRMQESEYAREARLIYEEVLAPENIGEQFSVDYNAKGGEYYPLGEDGNYCYTLIYYRDSENEACRLYVLYRSPYDKENGGYYSYTDTMTQIMDIFAVVKGTEEIIPSGKRTWSDTGSGAYRKATGE